MIIESYGSTEGALQAMRSGGADSDKAEGSTFSSANAGVIVDEAKTRLLDPSDVGVDRLAVALGLAAARLPERAGEDARDVRRPSTGRGTS